MVEIAATGERDVDTGIVVAVHTDDVQPWAKR